MYCNMPRLAFVADSRVRLHLMSLGDIADLHTPGMGEAVGGGEVWTCTHPAWVRQQGEEEEEEGTGAGSAPMCSGSLHPHPGPSQRFLEGKQFSQLSHFPPSLPPPFPTLFRPGWRLPQLRPAHRLSADVARLDAQCGCGADSAGHMADVRPCAGSRGRRYKRDVRGEF